VTTYLYHITHLRNLPAILARGELCCQALVADEHLNPTIIGYADLKGRRAQRPMPLDPGGVLADYVPWYFAPRSPMLYVIHKGGVPGYNEGQQPIVHLVSSVERVVAAQLPFVFTDGHAYVAFSRFFADLQQLDQIDWPLMRSRYWADTDEDNDRERRRNAEFLVHQRLPWQLIGAIGVRTTAVAEQVKALLHATSHRPDVVVRPAWYY
jgi:hypothetical protein